MFKLFSIWLYMMKYDEYHWKTMNKVICFIKKLLKNWKKHRNMKNMSKIEYAPRFVGSILPHVNKYVDFELDIQRNIGSLFEWFLIKIQLTFVYFLSFCLGSCVGVILEWQWNDPVVIIAWFRYVLGELFVFSRKYRTINRHRIDDRTDNWSGNRVGNRISDRNNKRISEGINKRRNQPSNERSTLRLN